MESHRKYDKMKTSVVNWRKEQGLFVQIPLHVLEIRMLLFFGYREGTFHMRVL